MLQSIEQTGKYCLEQGIPFPKIELTDEDKKNPKECYVFEDKENPDTPIVLHFPLVNASFKEYKSPGEYSTSLHHQSNWWSSVAEVGWSSPQSSC